MVNELVFRAADTATALEKVQDNLGENAYIIEIKNVGNFVEITASLQEPVALKGTSKTAPRNSVLVLSKRLQQHAASIKKNDSGNLGLVEDFGEFTPNRVQQSQNNFEHVPVHELEVNKGDTESSHRSENLEQKKFDQRENKLDQNLDGKDFPSSEPLKELVPEVDEKLFESHETPPIANPTEIQNTLLSFGDLLNIGLNADFIKAEFSISEFSGSITKEHLVNTLIKTFCDPSSRRILDVYYNIVLLGTPGSGKSTICAKLMQHYSLFREEKPRILQVSPDKFFELDRLSYFARLFNFPFERQQNFKSDTVFHADNQLTEISWDYYFEFFEALAGHGKHLSHMKLLLVLPASVNGRSLTEVMRVSRGVNSIILNKCDYGRITMKHLMIFYQNKCKIVGFSGDTAINEPIEFADEGTMRGFIEFVLEGSL